MKTTVELPDDLFRRAKAVAALRGRKFKDLVEEGLRRVLESPEDESDNEVRRDLLRQYCGIVDSGVTDLSTNPKYMEGFGRDNRRDR
jgi:hypothetical protein